MKKLGFKTSGGWREKDEEDEERKKSLWLKTSLYEQRLPQYIRYKRVKIQTGRNTNFLGECAISVVEIINFPYFSRKKTTRGGLNLMDL